MDNTFHVKTSADLNGLQQMSKLLDDIDRKAKSVSATFANMRMASAETAAASGGGAVHPSNTGTPQRRMQRAGNGGQSYNLNTPQGLYQWYENVYEPEAGVLAQMAQGFGQKFYGTRSRRTPMHTTMPTQGAPVNESSINSWFAGLAGKRSTMSTDVWTEYVRAGMNSSVDDKAIRNFYSQYGSQLGAPTGAPPVPSAGGGSGGGRGPFMPSTASEFGGALGGLAKNYLPWLTVGGAVAFGANQIKGGYNLWQQSSSPIDQLSHSLSTVAIGVENFRQQIVSTGAQFGFLGSQSAQAAQSLGQFYGNLGVSGIANTFGATAQFAQQNGFSIQQGTQFMNAAALNGITNGYGASMNASQYSGMLNNSVAAAGMQGRNGSYDTGFTSAANAVASQNLMVPNPQYLSGMYAQSVSTMGDMRGGTLFSSLNNSVMNASGTAQGVLFAAMNRTLGGKIGNQNLVNILAAQQGGLSSNVPSSNVKLGASLYNYLKNSGMPYDQQVLLASQFFHGNINQAEQFLREPSNFGQVSTSTHSSQSSWFSKFGLNQQVKAQYQSTQSNAGNIVAPFSTLGHAFGPITATGGTIIGSLMVGNILRGTASTGGGVLSGLGRGLGGIWSRFGGAIKGAGLDVLGGAEEVGGAALDATGVGAVGGVPLNVLGAGTIALGTGMLAKNIYNQSTAAHAQTVTMHTAQVRQQAAQRISSNMSLKSVTIDQLKIGNITLPSSMKSLMSSSVNAGSAYAPTSGANSGGGWWSSFTNWLGGLFGGGGGGSGGGGSLPTSLPGKGNSAQIWNFLKSKGLSSGAAAGIMGNLAQESGLNPNAPGGGLAQWIGGRQSALQAYAKAHGANPNALSTQLGYLWKEMSSGDYVSVSALNKMGSSQAAQYFETNFERAGNPMMGNRINYAAGYYNEFGGTSTVHVSSQSATQIGHAVASAFSARFGNLPTGTGGAIRP